MSIKTVQSIMHKKAITVQCQTPLTEIIDSLVKSQQSQLPVINNGNKLIGMVSLMDCQKALLHSAYHCDQPVIVNDIMAKNYTSLTIDQHLSEAAMQTQSHNESIFPVQHEGKFVGIMKRVDLLIELNKDLSLCSQKK
jgi:predicted transcriptional regulator